MKYFKVSLLGITLFLVLVVILQNTQTVTARLLWLDFSAPIAVMLTLNALLGFVSGFVCRIVVERRKQRSAPAA